MNTIIIDYDPFVMESRVSILNDGKREYANIHSSIEELPQNIIDLAYKNNIYDIKVNGPFSVATEIKERLKQYENTRYSTNKITMGEL